MGPVAFFYCILHHCHATDQVENGSLMIHFEDKTQKGRWTNMT